MRTGHKAGMLLLSAAMTILVLAGPALGQSPVAGAGNPPAAQPGSSPADNDYFYATWLYNAGKWAMAADEYGKFLVNYPAHARAADAQFGRSQALFQQGKYKEAADGFKTLLDRHPKFDKLPEAQFQLGQSYLGAGQLDAASGAFADMGKKFDAHYLAEWADAKRAECLINLKQYDQAEPLLAPLVNKYVRDQGAAERLAVRKKELSVINPQLGPSFEALVQRGEFNIALSQFGQKKYDAAAAGFAGFIDHNANSDLAESARFHRAQSLYFLGQFKESAVAYEDVVKAKGAMAAAASFERALAVYKSGDMKTAANLFVESARDFPDSDRAARARLYAGTCLYESADYPGAIAQFDAMIAGKQPVAVDEAKYWKGMAQLKTGLAVDASKTLEDAIRNHPGSTRMADMRLAYADALLAQDRFDGASAAYEAFAAAYPQNEAAARALYTAAFARHRAGQWLESSKLCAKFTADYPAEKLLPKVLFISGENQFLLKNWPQAAAAYKQLLEKFPDTEDADRARLRLAWSDHFQKQYDAALPVLDKISPRADETIKREANYLKANCLLELNRDDEAVKVLEGYIAAVGRGSYTDDALFKLALLRIRQNHRELAQQPLEQLIKDYPDSFLRTQAEYELAEVCLQQKRFADAVAHYQEVVKRDGKGPLAPFAQFGIGLCAYEQGQWKDAANAFASVTKDYPGVDKLAPQALYRQGLSLQRTEDWAVAENALTALVKKYPKDAYAASAIKAIGLGLEKQEKFDKAADYFALLIKEYPQAPELDQAYYELAWCYQKLNNKDQMLGAYKALADKFPDSPLVADAYYHVGEQQYFRKEYAAAQESYQKCLAAAKDDRLKDKALYRLGWSLWFQNKFVDAAARFDQVVKDHPASDLALDSLLSAGEAYLRADKPSEAADRLARLIDSPAAKDFKHLPEASLRLGESQLALGQPDKALGAFKSITERYPAFDQMPTVQFNIGRSYYELKKYDDAIKTLTAVIETDKVPGETAAKARFFLGESCLAAGNPKEALSHYMRVTVLYTAFPEWVAASYYQLGQAYLQLNNKADAAKQFQTLVDQFAQTKWGEAARKQLNQMK